MDTLVQADDRFRNTARAKALGAFYTDVQVADFLVWWAIRSSRNTVMDPSFGGGVFLRSACRRLLQFGGDPTRQVFGAELDSQVRDLTAENLSIEFGVREENLWSRDFFEIESSIGQVDAVVGNPPFIRYQRFAAETRKRGLVRAAAQGVKLTELSSSWAPFVIHSVSMLKRNGRLAMVVPFELTHAAYAKPVLNYLIQSFGRITLFTFRKRLFPELNEDTLLLLAENKGNALADLAVRDLADAEGLSEIRSEGHFELAGMQHVNVDALSSGKERVVEYLIPKRARELYHELQKSEVCHRLGQAADVGIGYVTGANDFFHLNPRAVVEWDIPSRFLKPAVRRGKALVGLTFTNDDWLRASEAGDGGYLLYINGEADLPESIRRYLKHGETRNIHETYKCRTRSPWFSVPHVYQPDAFLTYMSGMVPRLVVNEAGAVAPNNLHILRFYPLTSLTANAISALWHTSLTHLSAEIEGHSLGGGMLKLEPTEAEKVVLPVATNNGQVLETAQELDVLLRTGNHARCQERADQVLLKENLGLSAGECELLAEAARTLQNRRYHRGSSA